MLPYFKKYVLWVCVIAVAVPVIASTIYAGVTSSMVTSTLPGLIFMLVLLFGSMMLAQSYFGRKANEKTEAMLAAYNDSCDPEAFTQQAEQVVANMREPYDVMASWFLTYYAQALLDEGRIDQAKTIEAALLRSVDAAKNDSIRLGVLMNTVPLVTKTQGPRAALDLVERGLAIVERLQQGSQAADALAFLNNQKALLEAAVAHDDATLRSLYARVHDDANLPMRIRVESAWKEAQACHGLGDTSCERACLEFVVSNGNRLALATSARDRLAALAG